MHLIRLGAATLNQTPMAWDANQANILQAIRAARADGVDILCLPELCISGYGCEDALLGAGLHQQALRVLFEIAPQTQGLIVALGLPLVYENRVYNAACLLVDGGIAGFVAKRFLPGDGIHYEPRWFHPWPGGVHGEIALNGRNYPIGDIYFNIGGVRVGFEICEEAWVAKRPGSQLAQQGVDVILNPTASHFAFAKRAVRERLVLEGSRGFSASYVFANLLGNEAGRAIYDGDMLIASNGEMLARGQRFSFADWQLVSAEVDLDLTRMHQARTSSLAPHGGNCVQMAHDYPARRPSRNATSGRQAEAWENGAHLREEEFTRAVSLALFDYLRKSRARGFVLSLSGGADSGAIACLVRLLVELGMNELGADGFCAKLAYRDLHAADPAAAMPELLACVYQASRNSSDITRNAAASLANSLDAVFYEWSIDALVDGYVGQLNAVLGRELNWQEDDLALQNIQARARSPGVWMLANVRNALLLATSNRSEAAVGYATMDGDTSGGLSPLAGVDKDFIRAWLRWLESEGPAGLAPISALRLINVQQPTAELRPGQSQTDEADLMPYDVLNAIEKAAIRDRQTPYEILCRLRAQFDHDEADLLTWIERFFQLWVRNQWKRERYAPSFHLDDESLDPKTWCRFPILSGGFAHELAAMRAKAGESP